MKRQALTDGTGQWFDIDKATKFEEKTYWNGNDWVSLATSQTFTHETLFLTALGKFIKHCHSNVAGNKDTFEVITIGEAAVWFSNQNYPKEEIPEILSEEISSLEIE